MKIITLELGPMKNFVYIIADEDAKECAVVDPGWEPEIIIEAARHHDWKLTTALITHSHFDHCQATPLLVEKIPELKVYVHELDATRLENIRKSILYPQKDIEIGSINIKPIHTPGHQAGHVSYLVDQFLFTGDFLFIDRIGRFDFPESDPDAMYKSIYETIWNLPDDTIIMPGHDYGKSKTDTLGNQKKDNPFLMCKSKEEFLALRG